MTIATVPVYDATHANVGHLPKGHAAGYSTGSGSVPWTVADWNAHPAAVRICQDAGATDPTADCLDVEAGAATIADCARWARAATASVTDVRRPGQRHPAIYMSLSSVTPVVNALIAGGVTSGVGLWVANWNLTEAEATVLVAHAGGPFPIVGVQYRNAGSYDVSVFSGPWLAAVSAAPVHPTTPARPATGPFRHTAPGGVSLNQLAAARKTTASHLLQLTAASMTPADITVTANLPLPAGWVWYSTVP
jgi:hypothetical protein